MSFPAFYTSNCPYSEEIDMGDHHFVPENQLLVNRMDLEKSQTERSLYSSTETRIEIYKPKSIEDVLLSADNFETKELAEENIVVSNPYNTYKNAKKDLMVPDVGDGISEESYVPKLNLKVKSGKPFFTKSIKQESTQIASHSDSIADVVTAVYEIDQGRKIPVIDKEIHNTISASSFKGALQLSPFGVKAIESNQGIITDCGGTIDFATLAKWSGVLPKKNQPIYDVKDADIDNTDVTPQHQLRSILRKEQLDDVTQPEIKRSVHFGFPVVWTKYFTADNDNDSTASTELLFSDEGGERQELFPENDDQEVPHCENLDEPRSKKARTDGGGFIPSFAFPEVKIIPSLDVSRFTDKEHDHKKTTLANVQEIGLVAVEQNIEENINSAHEPSLVLNNDICYSGSLTIPVLTTVKCDKKDQDYDHTAEVPCTDMLPETDDQKLRSDAELLENTHSIKELIPANQSDDPDNRKSVDEAPCFDTLPDVNDHRNKTETELQENAPSCKELIQTYCHDEPDYNGKFVEVPCFDIPPDANDHTRQTDGIELHPESLWELVRENHCDDHHPDYENSTEEAQHMASRTAINNSEHLETGLQGNPQVSNMVPVNLTLDNGPEYVQPSNTLSYDTVSKTGEQKRDPDTDTQGWLEENIKDPVLSKVIYEDGSGKKTCDEYCEILSKESDQKQRPEKQENHSDLGHIKLLPLDNNDKQSEDNGQKEMLGSAMWNCHEEAASSVPSISPAPEKISVSGNVFAQMIPNTTGDVTTANLARVTKYALQGTQEVPESVCNRVNDYRSVGGPCSSLLQLGEDFLLEEVDSEPHTSTSNSLGNPWIAYHFIEFENTLYDGIGDESTSKIVLSDYDVEPKLECPSLSPVKSPWTKSFPEEEFCSCVDHDEYESCSSQISEITDEVKNLLKVESSSGYELTTPQSSSDQEKAFINVENQERKFPAQNKYSSQFLTALRTNANDLDGPELLEMAMHLVESALRKTKNPDKLESCPKSSTKSNKYSDSESKVKPAFAWKSFSYENQRATLDLDGEYTNAVANKGIEDGNPNSTKLYYNKLCTRPLRVGLSRRSRTHSLHPYAVRSRFDASGKTHQEIPDHKLSV